MPTFKFSEKKSNPLLTTTVSGQSRFVVSIFAVSANGDLEEVGTGNNFTSNKIAFEIKPSMFGVPHWSDGDTFQLVWVSSFFLKNADIDGRKFSCIATQDSDHIGELESEEKHVESVIDLEVTK